jgi:hypothetical protein
MSDWRDNFVFGRRGPGYTDQVLLDLFSIVHFISGIILYLIGFEFVVAFGILIIFEVWENSELGTSFWRKYASRIWPSQRNYVGDSWGNLIADIVVGSLGYFVGVWFF